MVQDVSEQMIAPQGGFASAGVTERVKTLASDQIGRRSHQDDAEWIEVDAGTSGHIIYGPYENRAAGAHTASFSLRLDDYPAGRLGDAVLAVIDIATRHGSVILARRQVRKAELEDGPKDFRLRFNLAAPRNIEYRVMSTGQASMSVKDVVELRSEGTAPNYHQAKESRLEREWNNEAAFLDGYLRNVTGIIHIGANYGQERTLYEILGLDVLWVEAMDNIYDALLDNIAPFRRQRAICALLTDRAGETFNFNVANGMAGSSSILDFDEHATIMPDIQYIEQREIVSTTFGLMVDKHRVDLSKYQALCLDIEGSELLVLKSMQQFLGDFDYIKCEVSDFSSRVGAPTSADLDDLLHPHGFRQLSRRSFGYGVDGNGTYWDIVWKKARMGESMFRPGVGLPFIANDESAWDHRMEESLSRHAIMATGFD